MKRAFAAVWAVGFLISCGTSIPDHQACFRDAAPDQADPNFCDRDNGDIESIGVTIMQGNTGTPSSPIAYSGIPVTFTVQIAVYGASSATTPLTDFNSYLALDVTPGILTNIQGVGSTQVVGRNVLLSQGVGTVQISFQGAYGVTRIWAQDQGYVPADPNAAVPPECSNGIDDNQNLRTDFPAEFGCVAPNDDSEDGGSYATGSSPPIYVGSPTIYDVRGGAATSPLVNQRVTITAGTMIVTSIDASGMYVTDIADRSCPNPNAPTDPTQNVPCFNSIFAFNFSLPLGVRPCDQLSQLQGSVQEFVSDTQLANPSWVIPATYAWIDEQTSGPCMIPDAIPITPVSLNNPTSELEPYQSSVVRATGISWPTTVGAGVACTFSTTTQTWTCNLRPGYTNCDVNNDGEISFSIPTEAMCSDQCAATVGCAEWTNWARFGQLSVDFVGQPLSTDRLYVAPKSAIPDFDPLNPPVTQATGAIVTGNLSQAGPTYIIVPRCSQDIVLMGTADPANQTCLLPRTLNEDQ